MPYVCGNDWAELNGNKNRARHEMCTNSHTQHTFSHIQSSELEKEH